MRPAYARIIFFFYAFPFLLFSQEKQEAEKDSLKNAVFKKLDSILLSTPKELNLSVLKDLQKKWNPKPIKKPEEGWKKNGKFAFFFNQSAFNNDWQGGGTSNVAGNIAINYDINYKKNSLVWDNRILADYGLTFLKGETFARKTTDRIEFNTRLGQQIGKSLWNYSLFVNFRSQFDKGYRFSNDPDTDETIRTEETHFFSPAFIQIGPGVLWKKSNDFNINIAPVTSRMIFVDDQFTSGPDYVDGDYFGIDAGESSRFEFGGSFSGYGKFLLFENITVENILNLYSNYIESPWNIDIDYALNINLKVNKYISGTFNFQAIYDDNATSGFQIREVIGLGLNYEF